MKTIAIAAMCVLALLVSAGVTDAKEATQVPVDEEVIGLHPGLESSETCDYTCPETYEIKCTQSSRFLSFNIGDDCNGAPVSGCARFADTRTQGALIALTPLGLYGHAYSTPGFLDTGGNYWMTLTRPGLEGLMKAVGIVTVIDAGDRFYAVLAQCFSNSLFTYRNTSLIKKFDH